MNIIIIIIIWNCCFARSDLLDLSGAKTKFFFGDIEDFRTKIFITPSFLLFFIFQVNYCENWFVTDLKHFLDRFFLSFFVVIIVVGECFMLILLFLYFQNTRNLFCFSYFFFFHLSHHLFNKILSTNLCFFSLSLEKFQTKTTKFCKFFFYNIFHLFL